MKICFLLLALAASAWRFADESGSPPRSLLPAPSGTAADSGKVVYDTYCLACHQADGRGVPGQNPPLAKTDWVLGDKTRLIGVILNGLNDPVEIGGETYDNPMPAHDFLTDQQVADVLTYVRSHFGNQAPAIKPEDVKAVRAKKK